MAEKENQEQTKKPIYTVIYNKDDRLWHITKSGAKRVIAKRVTKVEAMEKLPHVENIMPLSPEKALKNWGLIRIRPNYQKNDKAEFIIEKAQMIREESPEKSWFVYDNYKYILSYAIKVQILDKDNNVLKSTSIEGFISRKLPQKASVTQRDNMFAQMLSEMEDQLDKETPKEFKENLLDL